MAESAVVGVPHPDFGEVGVAVVIAKPGATLDADAIVAELKARLANFKIPKRCFVEAELPRNTMGAPGELYPVKEPSAMSPRALLLLLVGTAIVAFIGINWSAMTAPTDLNLLIMDIRAPLAWCCWG